VKCKSQWPICSWGLPDKRGGVAAVPTLLERDGDATSSHTEAGGESTVAAIRNGHHGNGTDFASWTDFIAETLIQEVGVVDGTICTASCQGLYAACVAVCRSPIPTSGQALALNPYNRKENPRTMRMSQTARP
jgi:hypothetical protein